MKYEETYPIGSMWKTRCGYKAVVLKHVHGVDFPVYLWVDGKNTMGFLTQVTGSGENSGVAPSEYDLISPWKDPIKGELWINLYHDPDSNMYPTRHGTYLSKEDADAELKNMVGLKLIKQIGPIEWEYNE